MKTDNIFRTLKPYGVLASALFACVATMRVFAAPSVSDFEAVPPLLAESAAPLVMLALSRDHQLFYKAFTDYDDLNNDGLPDTTYINAIDYEGYFDSYKCYAYSIAKGYFEPVANTSTKYCNRAANNQWSGNFLNWSSMTRIDEIRKVLYGGKRYNESLYASITVLERSILPNDAHSFAKYYNGTDLADLTPFGDNTSSHASVPTGKSKNQKSGLTICNTTVNTDKTTNNSSRVTAPPLMRVVAGNYHLWTANERWQCRFSEEKSAANNNSSSATGIYAAPSNPSRDKAAAQRDGTLVTDYVARVQVCKPDLIGTEDCKQYPDGTYKPVGILQKFGDLGQIKFGLMTGTYKKNKSGGVLRKQISPIIDEINVATNGSFITGVGGIIETIDRFRIANYNYNDGMYNDLDNCAWGKANFSESAGGSCTNWGNPFSEILMECYRYFAGAKPTPAFAADDSTIIPGLGRETTWKVPLDSDNICANLSVIAFNASTSSYDSDGLAGFADLNPKGGATAKSMTDKVGDGEGITGGAGVKKFFVGEHGEDKNQLCTAKSITSLGDVRGTCPDAPRLGGSYQVAGLAYHSKTNDIRADLEEDQVVQTYGITLSPAVPNVTIPVPGADGKVVRILPACRTKFSDTEEGNCGLVDFKVVQNYEPASYPWTYQGSFYVNWEDTEQGGDYDMDMYGMVHYKINATTISIETDVIDESTPYRMGFGFVVSGTTNDGFHVYSGIHGYSDYGCNNCQRSNAAKGASFQIGASSASLLEQPLYYAAKWGGFTDVDGDGTPNLQREWDQRINATGALGSDGLPDSYFYAVNPKLLKSQLTAILVSILDRTASGTSAAVVTNTGTGEGALYQALYNPRFASANGIDAVSWVGTLNALFIDSWGNLREDNAAPKGQLTAADSIVEVFYDAVTQKTLVQRYQLSGDGSKGAAVGNPLDVSEIRPIWSAREALGKVSNYKLQRASYSDSAATGRYILTAVDQDGDGQINATDGLEEALDFTADYFDPGYEKPWYRLLGLEPSRAAEAPDLVNYIRGEPVAGYRNRRIDIDGDGTLDPVLLGDIINSSPLAVGRPNSAYDLTFADDTYREFRQKYQQRRQMVYVGANDGMLHAFNAGFFDSKTYKYELSLNGETAHPLGAELWSYVPYNLLPHLQWLAAEDYPHVYYVDGSAKQYDVNIFKDDAVHPNGWGTILVVGMRFGGGEFALDPDSDFDGDSADDIRLRSGFIVLDITDPESPPSVVAEITHPDLGFTTAEPALVKFREANPKTGTYEEPVKNEWFLVFGSGPAGGTDLDRQTALRRAESSKSAKLFAFDLKDKTLEMIDTGETASFVGGIEAVDWARNYKTDAIYFGTIGGTVDAPKGKLKRGLLSLSGGGLNIDISDLMDQSSQPFSATPLTVRSRTGEFWVYAGTGRFFVVEDNFTDDLQSYYGIKDPKTGSLPAGTTVNKVDLIDTTDIRVFTDGSIESRTAPEAAIMLGSPSVEAKTFQDVLKAVEATDGWTFDFTRERSRNITQAVVSDQSLVFTEYQPSGLKCQPEGFGFLNARHLQAGIPGAFAPLGTNPGNTNGDGAEEVRSSEALGLGSPSAPSIYQRGDGEKVAVVQSSTGQVADAVIATGDTEGARESWRELLIDWEQ